MDDIETSETSVMGKDSFGVSEPREQAWNCFGSVRTARGDVFEEDQVGLARQARIGWPIITCQLEIGGSCTFAEHDNNDLAAAGFVIQAE